MTPGIVVLCGSTRFQAEMVEANRLLTLQGRIVLAPGVYQHTGHEITDAQKDRLDHLHLRKIDLAGMVLVVNPAGYIGSSTLAEIDHARRTGKPVYYTVATPTAVENVARCAIEAQLPGGPANPMHLGRDSDHPDVVRLTIRSTVEAIVAGDALHTAGYQVTTDENENDGVVLLVTASTCQACPPDCGSCTHNQADCECYEHQDVLSADQLTAVSRG